MGIARHALPDLVRQMLHIGHGPGQLAGFPVAVPIQLDHAVTGKAALPQFPQQPRILQLSRFRI